LVIAGCDVIWASGFRCSEGSYCLHLKGEGAFFLDCFTFESEDIMSLRNIGGGLLS